MLAAEVRKRSTETSVASPSCSQDDRRCCSSRLHDKFSIVHSWKARGPACHAAHSTGFSGQSQSLQSRESVAQYQVETSQENPKEQEHRAGSGAPEEDGCLTPPPCRGTEDALRGEAPAGGRQQLGRSYRPPHLSATYSQACAPPAPPSQLRGSPTCSPAQPAWRREEPHATQGRLTVSITQQNRKRGSPGRSLRTEGPWLQRTTKHRARRRLAGIDQPRVEAGARGKQQAAEAAAAARRPAPRGRAAAHGRAGHAGGAAGSPWRTAGLANTAPCVPSRGLRVACRWGAQSRACRQAGRPSAEAAWRAAGAAGGACQRAARPSVGRAGRPWGGGRRARAAAAGGAAPCPGGAVPCPGGAAAAACRVPGPLACRGGFEAAGRPWRAGQGA